MKKVLVLYYWTSIGQVNGGNGGLMQFGSKTNEEFLGFAILEYDRPSQRWIDAVRS